MGIFTTISRAISRVGEWLAEIACSLLQAIDSWVERIPAERVPLSTEYLPEEVDVRLSEKLKSLLAEHCPEGVVERMKRMSVSSRAEFVEHDLLPMIAAAMGVDYRELVWLESERLCGYYNHEQRTIGLNIAYLNSDSDKLLTIFVNTILHECKHARQHAAVNGVDFGYSQDLVDLWRLNFSNYITPEESDEAYVMQPVEMDASGFANSVVSENIVFEKKVIL